MPGLCLYLDLPFLLHRLARVGLSLCVLILWSSHLLHYRYTGMLTPPPSAALDGLNGADVITAALQLPGTLTPSPSAALDRNAGGVGWKQRVAATSILFWKISLGRFSSTPPPRRDV